MFNFNFTSFITTFFKKNDQINHGVMINPLHFKDENVFFNRDYYDAVAGNFMVVLVHVVFSVV